MNYKQLNGMSIRDGFAEYHKKNPHVFATFEREALAAIAAGNKKLSSKLIINYIRWNEIRESTGKNFRINDAYQSYYARLFVTKHPEHIDVFNFRKLRNEEQGPYMEMDANGQIKFL